MASIDTSILDHIVHLTPPGSLAQVTRQFVSGDLRGSDLDLELNLFTKSPSWRSSRRRADGERAGGERLSTGLSQEFC